MADIEDSEIKLTDCIEREISQEQFDACVSLAFNIGNHAFERSTLLQKLNAGRPFKEIGPQFDRWVFAGSKKMAGLIKRRASERKLFETGEYDARH
jgi:lysozyme